jgi:hypothetical protein
MRDGWFSREGLTYCGCMIGLSPLSCLVQRPGQGSTDCGEEPHGRQPYPIESGLCPKGYPRKAGSGVDSCDVRCPCPMQQGSSVNPQNLVLLLTSEGQYPRMCRRCGGVPWLGAKPMVTVITSTQGKSGVLLFHKLWCGGENETQGSVARQPFQTVTQASKHELCPRNDQNCRPYDVRMLQPPQSLTEKLIAHL